MENSSAISFGHIWKTKYLYQIPIGKGQHVTKPSYTKKGQYVLVLSSPSEETLGERVIRVVPLSFDLRYVTYDDDIIIDPKDSCCSSKIMAMFWLNGPMLVRNLETHVAQVKNPKLLAAFTAMWKISWGLGEGLKTRHLVSGFTGDTMACFFFSNPSYKIFCEGEMRKARCLHEPALVLFDMITR